MTIDWEKKHREQKELEQRELEKAQARAAERREQEQKREAGLVSLYKPPAEGLEVPEAVRELLGALPSSVQRRLGLVWHSLETVDDLLRTLRSQNLAFTASRVQKILDAEGEGGDGDGNGNQ